MAKIQHLLDKIRTAIYGKEVRGSLADGLEAINKETEDATEVAVNVEQRQDAVEQQFDDVLNEWTSDKPISNEETIAARTNRETGENHQTLGQRLDAENKKVTAQLAENSQKVIDLESKKATKDQLEKVNARVVETNKRRRIQNSYKTFGILKVPVDFPKKIPFNVFKNIEGKITHDFDFNQYKTDNKIYVHNTIGHDTEYDGKRETPFRTINKALEVANSGSKQIYNIVFLEKFVSDEVFSFEDTLTLEKDIVFTSDLEGGSFFTTTQRLSGGYVWERIDGVYRTLRKRVALVVDYRFKDVFGTPQEYLSANSINEVKNMRGSYYQDGDYIYVNRIDGSEPDDDVALLLPYISDLKINLKGKTLLIDNVHFWRCTRNDREENIFWSALNIKGNGNDRLVLKDSSFRYARFNGLSVEGVGECFSFNVQSMFNGYDGFNYHGDGSELVIELNCYAAFNGDVHGGTGNATSAHDGMSVFRAGVVGHDCWGPVLADVNGCYSVNYDCTMYNSLRSPKETKAAFYFDDSGAVSPGKTYLIDCGGGGNDTFSINSDGAEVNVRNFKGDNIPEALELNIID